jgi:hypothetical protein
MRSTNDLDKFKNDLEALSEAGSGVNKQVLTNMIRVLNEVSSDECLDLRKVVFSEFEEQDPEASIGTWLWKSVGTSME